MTESPFEHIRLSNGATVNDAIRYLNGLRATEESLGWRERELLSVAEGLLELVRLGAVIYMDSAAIETDLYGTEIAAPGEHGATRPSRALRACDPLALHAIFDRHRITEVHVFGSVVRETDEPGSDLDLLFSHPDTFSGFTMMEAIEDLEALLGVPVDLVSNDPDNTGATMERIRASAIPLAQFLRLPGD